LSNKQIVDVSQVIDQQPLSRFQIKVILLCAAALFMDGFDVTAMGYVAPGLSKLWGLKPGALGPVFGAGLSGLMVGALILSPLSDRIGRKKVIAASALLFGIFSLATPLADSLDSLFWLRFATGLGLGGAMPNAIALTSEFLPRRVRSTLTMVMFFGFSLGSGLGGAIAALLIGKFGWKAVFLFGGAVPLLLVPLLLFALPESIRVLTLRGNAGAQVAAFLSRINPSLRFDPATTRFVASDEHAGKGFPVQLLFREGRTLVTLMFWVMFFVNLLELYFLANWLPTVAHNSGLSEQQALVATGLIHIGGIFGTLVLGRLIDKLNPYAVLAVTYFMGGVFVACIGLCTSGAPLLMSVTFCAGFCIVGGQISANALAANYYPTVMRATGVGWALGIGRIGSVVGPVVGGIVIGMQWATPTIFAVGATPIVLATVAVLIVGRLVKGAGATEPQEMGAQVAALAEAE
jgi:MFS transporter, AAHS family, 4-hydroxybenzoate transporter